MGIQEPPPNSLEERLQHFAELLRASPHNLLSPRGLAELEERHLPESLAFAAQLPAGPRLLDLGSGGGLPGLVIAAARPDLEVHLLEATGKKATFLTDASAQLGLSVTVHHGRAEDLGTAPLAGTFEIVTARAVAPLDRLVPWAAPFLKREGQLHAIKGDRWQEELAAAAGALRTAGMEVLARPDAEPGPAGAPTVVVLERRRKALE